MDTDNRQALELARTAEARFETTNAAAETYGLEPERLQTCSERILERIHRGPCQENVIWVLEIAQGMITAVMAVAGEPLPVAEQVDPASYAMATLRDIATAAVRRGLDFAQLEEEAVACLRTADDGNFNHLETYWSLNRATASCELAWARSLAQTDSDDPTGPAID